MERNTVVDMPSDCPLELWVSITEFWPESEWINAVNVARLESGLNAFAVADTTDAQHPCGSVIGERDGVRITAERSISYFQINSCNFPDWPSERFFNARHNAGTAHQLWDNAGGSWAPWFFSAQRLG